MERQGSCRRILCARESDERDWLSRGGDEGNLWSCWRCWSPYAGASTHGRVLQCGNVRSSLWNRVECEQKQEKLMLEAGEPGGAE